MWVHLYANAHVSNKEALSGMLVVLNLRKFLLQIGQVRWSLVTDSTLENRDCRRIRIDASVLTIEYVYVG